APGRLNRRRHRGPSRRCVDDNHLPAISSCETIVRGELESEVPLRHLSHRTCAARSQVDPPIAGILPRCRSTRSWPTRKRVPWAVTGGLVVPKERPSRLVVLACMPASVTSSETGARAPLGQQTGQVIGLRPIGGLPTGTPYL